MQPSAGAGSVNTQHGGTRCARACAEYGYAVKNVFYLCGRIVNYLGFGAMPEHFDLEEALNELGRLASERTAKWESVLLLGTAETVSAARKWHRLVGKAQALSARDVLTSTSGTSCMTRLMPLANVSTRQLGATWI